MAVSLTIYTHPCFLDHDTGPGHPERRERLQALFTLLNEKPFCDLPRIDAAEASTKDILRVHDRFYLDRLEAALPDHGCAYLDSDTVISPGSWQAALTAAGAVCQAVDDVLDGKTKRAFCAVRPPGHHAFPDHAEGFCLLNNIMIGALKTARRVAIVDFDVHHGNGTDFVARKHDNIFYASTHQWPLYPGTGLPEDDIPGRIINRTMAAGDGSAIFRKIYETDIFPALDVFKPDLLMISAGFDAHQNDPLAQINLTDNDFSWITAELVKIAHRHCGGKIVSVLEGGYDLEALKSSAAAHIRALS